MSNHEHEHCGCGCEHHDHDHKPMDKYMTAINQSNVTTDDAAVSAAVQEIIDKHANENTWQPSAFTATSPLSCAARLR